MKTDQIVQEKAGEIPKNRLRVAVKILHGRWGKTSLKAKGTLISESRFSTPCDMRFCSHAIKGMAFCEGFCLTIAFSVYRVGKLRVARGRKSGLTFSVPLAPRDHQKETGECHSGS